MLWLRLKALFSRLASWVPTGVPPALLLALIVSASPTVNCPAACLVRTRYHLFGRPGVAPQKLEVSPKPGWPSWYMAVFCRSAWRSWACAPWSIAIVCKMPRQAYAPGNAHPRDSLALPPGPLPVMAALPSPRNRQHLPSRLRPDCFRGRALWSSALASRRHSTPQSEPTSSYRASGLVLRPIADKPPFPGGVWFSPPSVVPLRKVWLIATGFPNTRLNVLWPL